MKQRYVQSPLGILGVKSTAINNTHLIAVRLFMIYCKYPPGFPALLRITHGTNLLIVIKARNNPMYAYLIENHRAKLGM